MRTLLRLVVLGLAGYGAYSLYEQFGDRLPGRTPGELLEIDVVDYEVSNPPSAPTTLG